MSDGIWSRLPAEAVSVKAQIGRICRPQLERVEALMLDRRIETARPVGPEQLGVTGGQVHYVASGWFFLRRGLRGYRVSRSGVFVDFGSGKGRLLYQAARLPFGRVVGIELFEHLNQIARQNLERNRSCLTCQ